MKTKSLLGIVAILALLLGACANSVGPSVGSSNGTPNISSDNPVIAGVPPVDPSNSEDQNQVTYEITTVTKDDGKDYYHVKFSYVDENGNSHEATIDLPDGSTIASVEFGVNENGDDCIIITFTDSEGNTQPPVYVPIVSGNETTNENAGDSENPADDNNNQGDDNQSGGNEDAVLTGITGIQITNAPNALYYGQALSGYEVMAYDDDGPVAVIPNDELSVSGYEATQLGAQTVTVSYGSFDAAFNVTVKAIGYDVESEYLNNTSGSFNYKVTFTFEYPVDLSESGKIVTVTGSGSGNTATVGIGLEKQQGGDGRVWIGTAPFKGVGGKTISIGVVVGMAGIDGSIHYASSK